MPCGSSAPCSVAGIEERSGKNCKNHAVRRYSPTVTTIGPVVAPEGTQTTIFVALQLVGVALVPLNLTVLVPCVEPKFDPVMVMQFPTAPDDADSALMLGGAFVTVKLTPLLARPPTVTTTLPVLAPLGTEVPILVALQLVAVAVIPLNVTVLDPWADPKLVPET